MCGSGLPAHEHGPRWAPAADAGTRGCWWTLWLLNRSLLVRARRRWIAAGWHPPDALERRGLRSSGVQQGQSTRDDALW